MTTFEIILLIVGILMVIAMLIIAIDNTYDPEHPVNKQIAQHQWDSFANDVHDSCDPTDIHRARARQDSPDRLDLQRGDHGTSGPSEGMEE